MKDEYRGKEKGPCVLLHIRDNEVSYTVPDHTGVPEATWQNNGWELIPLATPPIHLLVDNYVHNIISCFLLLSC